MWSRWQVISFSSSAGRIFIFGWPMLNLWKKNWHVSFFMVLSLHKMATNIPSCYVGKQWGVIVDNIEFGGTWLENYQKLANCSIFHSRGRRCWGYGVGYIVFVSCSNYFDIELETNLIFLIHSLFSQNEVEEMDGVALSRSYTSGVPQTVSSEYVLPFFIIDS